MCLISLQMERFLTLIFHLKIFKLSLKLTCIEVCGPFGHDLLKIKESIVNCLLAVLIIELS